jgi:imidazolonepropionase-like amidohydrolase
MNAIKTVVRISATLLMLASLVPLPALAADSDRAPKLAPAAALITNATIWTQGRQGLIEGADLLVADGKIVAVGQGLAAPDGAHIVDATGKHVTPGLIDTHAHLAIRGGGNEGANNITAEVRIQDVTNPEDINIYRQLAGGLTTSHSLHGSANSIGGQDAVLKLHWNATAAELVVPDRKGIKFALGENPKRSRASGQPGPVRYPKTRMGVIESIRTVFLEALDYQHEWDAYEALPTPEREHTKPPRRNLQLDAIVEILYGERSIHCHAYRQDEILAILRLAEEFGISIATFEHALEGYKVADEMAAAGAGASTFSDWWAYKMEAFDAIPYNGALLNDRGVSVSFSSDSAELARRMNLEAAKAVKYGGVDEQEALAFVTINAARQLALGDRIGSLEEGKDADFVIWTGDPLSVFSIVEQTWVDGVREFDRETDLAERVRIERERAELIAEISGSAKADDADPPQEKDAAGDEVAPAGKPTPGAEAAAEPLPYSDRLAEFGKPVSIVGATVHTMTGEPIADGTVSFSDGKIVEVGANLQPLPGAEVIDASGKHVYPGLIDANNVVGLAEISAVAATVDISETGAINANVNTAIAVNPDSELIPVTRANGITHVLAAPGGDLIHGSSALIRLDGWTWEDLTAASPVAMHISWPSFRIRTISYFGSPPSREDQEKQRDESLKKIQQVFDDANAYATAKQAEGAGGHHLDADPMLEALLPVLNRQIPVIVYADDVRQIKSAVDFGEKQGLRMIIAGSRDIWRSADFLATRGVPVILTNVLELPSRNDEPYDTAYAAAAKLYEAGVKFCFAGSANAFAAANARNLPYHAAMAAAFGLPRDEAIKAITLYPAQILGVGDHLGSIEAGKSASVIITDGNPLEIRTHVERSFIDGRKVDLQDNRHDRLYRRYAARPVVDSN